jgi:hypothetical protein
MLWLRLYTNVPENQKLQQMPAEEFRTLVSFWCITKDNLDRTVPGRHGAAALVAGRVAALRVGYGCADEKPIRFCELDR